MLCILRRDRIGFLGQGLKGKRCCSVCAHIGFLIKELACVPLAKGIVELAIEADHNHYHFSYSDEKDRNSIITQAETRYLSTEVAGGFTGVFFGVYATGNGKDSSTWAYIDWFEYTK